LGYVIEGLEALIGRWVPSSILKALSLPLGLVSNWLLGATGVTIAITGLASAFIYLVIMKIVNRQVTLVNNGGRRVI
jgi:hypothetical protein